MRIRCAIHDADGEAVVYVDTSLVTPEIEALIDPIIRLLTPTERDYLVATLIRELADSQAYQREAARRGVLAL